VGELDAVDAVEVEDRWSELLLDELLSDELLFDCAALEPRTPPKTAARITTIATNTPMMMYIRRWDLGLGSSRTASGAAAGSKDAALPSMVLPSVVMVLPSDGNVLPSLASFAASGP
jgi:hypothetical protein